MTVWIALILSGLLTYGLRALPVFALHNRTPPRLVLRASELMAPVMLTALYVHALRAQHDLQPAGEELRWALAVGVALFVALRWRSLGGTVAAGLAGYGAAAFVL
jgi:branched-subunit amino acid transport protein